MSNYFPNQVFQYCPRCGSTGFLMEQERFFRCSNCNFVYYINAAAAVVALIFDKAGRLLLTVRKHDPAKGTLDLPGGFLDLNETVENALKREICEELNLTIESFQFFCSVPNQYLYSGLTYFTIDLTFICKVDDFSGIEANDDVADFVFMKPAEIIPEQVGLTSIRNIIKKIQKEIVN
jgi:NADH pyrophosphatase NudC (nudix superfamily)